MRCERHLPCEKGVHDYSEGPHISGLPKIVFLENKFRRKVVRSPAIVRYLLITFGWQAETEIDHLDNHGSWVYEHIVKLEVSVHDVVSMQVGERLQELFEDRSELLLGDKFVAELAAQCAAWKVFHHEVYFRMVFERSMQTNNVWVVAVLKNSDFLLK